MYRQQYDKERNPKTGKTVASLRDSAHNTRGVFSTYTLHTIQ